MGYAYDDVSQDPIFANVEENYFKRGPSSQGGFFDADPNSSHGSKIYFHNNIGDDATLLDFNENPQNYSFDFIATSEVHTPINITIGDITTRFNDIVSECGASKPIRDAVDNRIVNEVLNGTGKVIDSQNEVGGYPSYDGVITTIDVDSDGMDDNWEDANGFDKTNSEDGKLDSDNDGYTNLEEYLNDLVE